MLYLQINRCLHCVSLACECMPRCTAPKTTCFLKKTSTCAFLVPSANHERLHHCFAALMPVPSISCKLRALSPVPLALCYWLFSRAYTAVAGRVCSLYTV